MARHLLTDRRVQNAKPRAKPYRLADGDGLYLYVPPSGALAWQFRYRLGDKPQTATIGRLDRVTQGAPDRRGKQHNRGCRVNQPAEDCLVPRLLGQ